MDSVDGKPEAHGAPGRIRIRLQDDAAGATPLDLPERRMWPAGLIVGGMFAIFAGVAWTMVARISGRSVDDVFDLMFVLFEGFWLLGWSVGVVILGALTVLLFFYGESARLQGGRLVHVPRLGPLKIIIEYDLARVRNVRLENAAVPAAPEVRTTTPSESVSITTREAPDSATACRALTRSGWSAASEAPWRGAGSVADTTSAAPARAAPAREAPRPERPAAADTAPPSLMSPSGLALIGANLVPLAGVLFFGWDLAGVIVLFWAESAVIGFYTALKMAVVGKFPALLAVPFFIGHFGGFMAGHFLFIYTFFVRGIDAAGPAPGAREALQGYFRSPVVLAGRAVHQSRRVVLRQFPWAARVHGAPR